MSYAIDSTEPVLFVEVPHQLPVRAQTFSDLKQFLKYCVDEAAHCGGSFEDWAREDRDDPDFDPWGLGACDLDTLAQSWLTHDLSRWHIFECATAADKRAEYERIEQGREHGYIGTLAALNEWASDE